MTTDGDRPITQRGWRPDVHRRLCELIASGGDDRAVAVFDFDNTCVLGDIGEAYGHYLVETMRYRYDLERFWDLVHPDDGRRRLREVTEEAMNTVSGGEDAFGSEEPAYRRYLAEMMTLYDRRLERAGKRDCYEWAVRLHVGLDEEEMRQWSTAAIRRELQRTRESVRFSFSDGREIEIQRGIRPFVEIRRLFDALRQVGWEVWIVSATNEWTVRQFAPVFGVPTDRVLGNRVGVVDGELTDETESPVLFREGKVEAIDRRIGTRPDLVVGDAVTDYEMLCCAQKLAVVVDRGDEMLRREADDRGWAMQPQEELTPETVEFAPESRAVVEGG